VNERTYGRPNEQQKTRSRLYEEAGQPLLHGLAVAGEIQSAADNPDEPEHGRGDIVQVYCAKPKRHQESRHPFKRVHMRAEAALEVGISGRCRELNAELAMRRRDASRKKEKRLRPAM
jgi:hypothetical protein